jgi:transcriptional regulator GlxA family with amidase domain
MKHVSILVLNEAKLNSIEEPHQAFNETNNILISKGKSPMFKVHLVGLTKEVHLNNGLYTVTPQLVIDEVEKTDLIIIPAVHGNVNKAVKLNEKFIPWIVNQYNKGAEVASLCVGAFLLASTGLLNGKQCSTHWRAANEFRNTFPDVNLVVDRIITDEHGIYSSGGAFSSANLILYLIEKYAGRRIAINCAKMFQIDIERGSQSPFIMFKGQKEHNDDTVKKAQEFIEDNFGEKITVNKLAAMLALSRRNLERRFKKATCNTVTEYIQRVKIEAAKMSLESSQENVNEVMYNVGYQDPKAFRTVFKRFTGLSPIQYRNKYNREFAV